ncbi:hypothetical protein V6N13_097655 [Hibiscus sabdariffa]
MLELITPGRAVVPGSRQQTGGPSTSRGQGLAGKDPSTEPYTPMPPVFSHASSSQFQLPMAPPTEGFFTPPGSLFATGPSGSGHHAADDDNAGETEDDDDDDDAALVRRNPSRNRRAPSCGTGGHRGN